MFVRMDAKRCELLPLAMIGRPSSESTYLNLLCPSPHH